MMTLTLTNPLPTVCVRVRASARRLEENKQDGTGASARPLTLTSVCSRQSLSCSYSSASLHTLMGSEDHTQPRTGASCSRVVRAIPLLSGGEEMRREEWELVD